LFPGLGEGLFISEESEFGCVAVEKYLDKVGHQGWVGALWVFRVEKMNITRVEGLLWICIMYLPQNISRTGTDNIIISQGVIS
jgi:hypothetical protein